MQSIIFKRKPLPCITFPLNITIITFDNLLFHNHVHVEVVRLVSDLTLSLFRLIITATRGLMRLISQNHRLKLFKWNLAITVLIRHPNQWAQILTTELNFQDGESAAKFNLVEITITIGIKSFENLCQICDALPIQSLLQLLSQPGNLTILLVLHLFLYFFELTTPLHFRWGCCTIQELRHRLPKLLILQCVTKHLWRLGFIIYCDGICILRHQKLNNLKLLVLDCQVQTCIPEPVCLALLVALFQFYDATCARTIKLGHEETSEQLCIIISLWQFAFSIFLFA